MFEIRQLRQIRALSSPARQAIVDAIESVGPCTANDLGQILGRASDRLYYHLQILKKVGLVRSRRHRNRSGRLEERFDLPGRPTWLRYEPSDPKNVEAVTKLVGAMLRDAHRAFAKGFTEDAVVRGRGRTLWAGRRTGWLTSAELNELNVHLHRMIALLECGRRERRPSRLYAFTFSVSPYGRANALTDPVKQRARSKSR